MSEPIGAITAREPWRHDMGMGGSKSDPMRDLVSTVGKWRLNGTPDPLAEAQARIASLTAELEEACRERNIEHSSHENCCWRDRAEAAEASCAAMLAALAALRAIIAAHEALSPVLWESGATHSLRMLEVLEAVSRGREALGGLPDCDEGVAEIVRLRNRMRSAELDRDGEHYYYW